MCRHSYLSKLLYCTADNLRLTASAACGQVMSTFSSSSSSVIAISSPVSSVNCESKGSESSKNPLVTKVRRHQSHLLGNQTLAAGENESNYGGDNERGGPKTLRQLKLRVLARNANFVVLNKGPDERLDGAFDVTLEKAVRHCQLMQLHTNTRKRLNELMAYAIGAANARLSRD